MQFGGFGQLAQIKLNAAFIRVVDVALVELGFSLDKLSVKPAVGYVMHQGIRDVADAAQARRLKRQLRGGNIDAHSANHDWNQFFFAEFQPEIINSFHQCPSWECVPASGYASLFWSVEWSVTMSMF